MELQFSPIENKILQLLIKKNISEAINIFKRSFSHEKPPTFDFIQKCYIELNKLGKNYETYQFMLMANEFVPKHPEIQRLFELARKVYYDSLIVEGNKILDNIKQKMSIFFETIQRADTLTKDKLEKENKRLIEEMYQQAIGIFKKAHEVWPRAISSLSGLYKCYKELGKNEEAKKIAQEIEKIYKFHEVKFEEDEEKSAEIEQLVEFDDQLESKVSEIRKDFVVLEDLKIEIERIEKMISENKLNEASLALDILLLGNQKFVPALLLKAKIHELKSEFNQAQKLLEKAEKIEPTNELIKKTKLEFLEKKYKLLQIAIDNYFSQAIKLGSLLGRNYFEKALICINQALEICPSDLDLLDKKYTCLIYLNRENEAQAIRRNIYLLDHNYSTYFEREYNKSFCFIASLCYPNNKTAIEDFKTLRREVFFKFSWGKKFINLYYAFSPKLVEIANKRPILILALKFIIIPFRFIGICLRNIIIKKYKMKKFLV